MVFSSLLFLLLFLPVTFLFYLASPKKLKNGVLFLFSLVFYAWGEPVYVLLMLFSTVLDYSCGRLVEKYRGTKKKKIGLILSVIVNLGMLFFFKYTDFLIETINSVFHSNLPLLNLPLPIGISFYTFQTMSYTIDVYRGDAKMQKNIISFGAYVALFPQLIAGPIVRYSDIAEQLNDHPVTWDGLSSGLCRFLFGLAKKILLANQIGKVWDAVSSSGELTVLSSWLGAIAFTFQIYFDFSAYSDMAIGLGKMFGFRFQENFNYPYLSKSITEFWRRWHISLGTWFREYVYIPLGGNRKGVPRQILNLFIVWALTGIWHGAAWQFLIWGLYFFLLLALEKFVFRHLEKLPLVFRHLYALFFIVIGWVIFACSSSEEIFSFFKAMFGIGAAFSNSFSLFLFTENIILLLIMIVAATPYPKKIAEMISKKLSPASFQVITMVSSFALFFLSLSFLVADSYNPFLYFRF